MIVLAAKRTCEMLGTFTCGSWGVTANDCLHACKTESAEGELQPAVIMYVTLLCCWGNFFCSSVLLF